MRIALISPPWVPVPPPAYGGTEAVLDTLARGLSKAGHDVLLYATGDSTCPVTREWYYEHAVGVGVAGAASELCHVVHAYEKIRGFDVVHDHTLVGPVYAQRYPDLPVVTTNHGPFDGELGHLYRAIGNQVPVIAISHNQAAAAQGFPIAAVIHHGLDLDTFPMGAGTGGYALFLGRMNPEKGAHIAARVALAAGIPLLIAAKMREPAEHAYYEKWVRPLLGGTVEYVGEVGRAEKLSLLSGATCLLNPIAWPEPFGLVMIEALACGTPVVATPCGAAPEIVDVGKTGFLAADHAGLVAALRKVGDLDRRACREAVRTRFSAARMVAEHVRLYEQSSIVRPIRAA